MPFLKSFAPGKKSFDFYVAQVSNYARAAQGSDLQRVVLPREPGCRGAQDEPALEGALARRPQALPARRLASGPTSYNYIVKFIKPTQSPRVYDTVNDAVTALKNKQIDGLVHDFPSMGYVTNVQVPGSTVVGRLPNQGAQEHFGLVFQKGNPLVRCVNKAINQMRADGTLKRLEVRWLGQDGRSDPEVAAA